MNIVQALREARDRGIGRATFRSASTGHEATVHCGDLEFADGDSARIHLLLANDWEIQPEPMCFGEAMIHLQEGKKVRRRHWENRKGATFLCAKTASGWPLSSLTYEDVSATDWEVID